MTNPLSRLRVILCGAGLVFLAGCASSPEPRYFVLEAPAASNPVTSDDTKQMVMIGPITVSEHLKRRGIASREEQGRVIVHPFDRWAGDLNQNIGSVVTEILQQKRGSDNVIDYYSNFSAEHDYAIKIHISKFDRVPGSQVALVASWQIRVGASTTKTVRSGNFSQPISGLETGDTISAMNAALAQLADALHQSLQK